MQTMLYNMPSSSSLASLGEHKSSNISKYLLVPEIFKQSWWWAIHEAKVTTWKVFSEEFKKQFASWQMENVWWTEMDETRQGAEQSVGDVALCLQELFGLVSLANEAQKIQILLKAHHPEIAYEVEKSGLPRSWDKLFSVETWSNFDTKSFLNKQNLHKFSQIFVPNLKSSILPLKNFFNFNHHNKIFIT
ncbi:hypothetical protein PHYBLDRAFT_171134 [Phycomyces blakesleeanus NRRL 1555(-)]|uniref:Retrotransposon gag domain-containing protein n=1 Tax=Phycomyces blakesleeanus (strain ATCC 8743b / DSM 1359 / FGSC 10004 / NBRC 33097 / NRRL 1555) TaxID=763407 RepID=A0A167LTK7_PHYB8|nr:hypothetical protein PHYBLDRAFT_171134 [Phycomyces blakesleeanus NRRL 1555(-)]OAD71074.1 hypothetical protein PHYBLDRAFT_171134 [Phycomyces blakesleeanus NRRL 1555(-)]|eukprot:XP_018289114.1 hypothetical protein PHYBLDRAFT_171134 [Phycomyces blakesleeanus NRRL 1555(-)]